MNTYHSAKPPGVVATRILLAAASVALFTSAPSAAIAASETLYGETDLNETRVIGVDDSLSITHATDPDVAPVLNVGIGSGETGVLNLNGGSLSFTTDVEPASMLRIGQSGGTGTLNMTSGTLVFQPGAKYGSIAIGTGAESLGAFNQSGGTVTIGDGSLSVGASGGQGTLTLSSSAVFNAGVTNRIGRGVGSNGLVEVKESASFNMLDGDVGFILGTEGGTGTFRQGDDAVVTFSHTARTRIGDGAGSVGNFEMNGGTLIMDAGQWAGENTPGYGFTLGFTADATGNYTQTDGTATFSKAMVTIGYEGTGNFKVQGGTAQVTEKFIMLGSAETASGLLEISGTGVLEIGRSDAIRKGQGSAQFNLAGGELRVIGSDLSVSVAPTLVAGTVSTINTNGFNATLSAGLSGEGDLIKTGLGKLTVNGATSTGALTIGQGIAEFTNATLGFDTITVESGAMLSGTSGLTLAAGSELTIEIAGIDDFGKIAANGVFDANGATLNVLFIEGYNPNVDDAYDLFDFTGFGTQFANVNIVSDAIGVWDLSQLVSDGVIRFSAIPEPGAFALMAGAIASVTVCIRRRKRHA